MQPQAVIFHERRSTWSRQIRPRFHDWPVRWSETRSAAELARASGRSACPILIVDLADRPARGLEDLGLARAACPDALALVLDPGAHPGLPDLARELGATHVLPGPVVPPQVVALLLRWLPLARRRAESGGWAPAPDEPGPADPLLGLLSRPAR